MNFYIYTVFLFFVAILGLFSSESKAQQQQPPKPATVTAVKPGVASPQQKTGGNKDSSESEEDDKISHQKANSTTGAAPPPIPAFCQQNAADPAVQKCCTALKTAAAAHKVVQGAVKLPECVQCGQKCNNAPTVNGAVHTQVAANAPKPH